MKIYVNCDNENSGVSPFIIKTLKKWNIYTNDSDCPIVFNIDSIYQKGFKKGKISIYLENDTFIYLGKHTDWYQQADLFYIGSKHYLKWYPTKTKIMTTGYDPDFHKELPIKKKYKYAFIGTYNAGHVYQERDDFLNSIKDRKDVLITYGTRETYPELLSSAEIILNVLPKKDGIPAVNMRVFEGMACGCLMTNYDPIIDEFAQKNVHYLTLDKFDKVTDEEIERVKKAGKEHVKKYSYDNQLKIMIKDIEDLLK